MTTTMETPGAAADQAAQTDARQFVTFSVGDEVFAVPMAPVREIIRVPETVRVPLSPPSLEGLANLRGLVPAATVSLS
jgi:purine-binding chemotaxis protein CheW